jgi:SAM-dependent methyltransferase
MKMLEKSMLTKLIDNLPEGTKELIRSARDKIYPVLYLGKGRHCPVCEKESRKFRTFGIVPRKDAQCVHCGSLERHRFIWIYFKKMTNLFDETSKRILHVAPERCFIPKLKKQFGQNYVTADLTNPRADVKMDITDIEYPDEYFDVIYCSHVLEHVQEDRKAMSEFYRVLKKGGWAILLVPITTDKTFEDPSIVDPAERLRVFGQSDHVRMYGTDYIERLREAGFTVSVSYLSEIVDKKDLVRMGLTAESGEVFYCTKE